MGWRTKCPSSQEETQRNKGRPARFESFQAYGRSSESKYAADKRECRAVLKVLKTFKNSLYGVHVRLEVDALTPAAELNRSATDLPGALVTQWIPWIRLFDLEVKRVPGKKNVVADALSRRPAIDADRAELQEEEDIDEWASNHPSSVRLMSIRVSSDNAEGSQSQRRGVIVNETAMEGESSTGPEMKADEYGQRPC
ncbi:hypothetical protein AYO21_11177 [Fonsecaea monophora]|uniref:Reverse transcriptase RNase H-like domain-containing protein n=1 Tax=Fonsecaea monophora TaxID=254056 RepID=A0A177ERM4_9EURO|nr:hypothetical protein AYO21_11177 [Fonsecaea monophora]KAH0829890.1 hypothetical protein FOPE_10770 [Fonsecaea pedrosoi]OAG34665.1 hypothetical protein AYO21_11177 [Fonsecaea monophora]